MSLPPVPRDKLDKQYELLVKYFASVPPKSGKILQLFELALFTI